MEGELILVAIAAASLVAMLVLVIMAARQKQRNAPVVSNHESLRPPMPVRKEVAKPPRDDPPAADPSRPLEPSPPPEPSPPQPVERPPDDPPPAAPKHKPATNPPPKPSLRPHNNEGAYAFVAPTLERKRKSDRPRVESAAAPDDEPHRDIVMDASRSAATFAKQVDIVGHTPPPAGFDRIELRQAWWGDTPLELSVGLESQQVPVGLLSDAAVRATRVGMTIESLEELIDGQPCDLGNIEVFYRLGLSYLAGGEYAEAHEYFGLVEVTSPGYRAADARARAVRQWHAALGDELTASPEAVRASQYQLLGELGRGAAAVVYHARDTVGDRSLALKILSEELSTHPIWCDRMLRAARAAASLEHPGIVSVHDCGLFEGRVFIGMDRIDGSPVDDLRDQLTIVESLRIGEQALQALDHAHEQDVLHLDVKPSNLMRTRGGQVKLVDFGLGKPLEAIGTSTIAGTPAFMSPEQLAGEPLDRRADIFAMGVTLYLMLTRELPYRGRDRNAPPPSPQQLVPAIPDQVDAAIMRAIARHRDDRWASAKELAEALRHVLGGVGRFSSKPPPIER